MLTILVCLLYIYLLSDKTFSAGTLSPPTNSLNLSMLSPLADATTNSSELGNIITRLSSNLFASLSSASLALEINSLKNIS